MKFCKGLIQWSLVPIWSDKKKLPHKHENFINILKTKQKNPRDRPNGTFCPLGRLFYSQLKSDQNIDNKMKMILWRKALDNSQNNCEGLTKWAFFPVGTTLVCRSGLQDHQAYSLYGGVVPYPKQRLD